jgi:hypothetical protein
MFKNFSLLALVGMFVLMSASSIQAAGEWRFPVGLSYVSGFSEITSRYENNLKAEGYSTTSVSGWPVGVQFQPYYQFDFGLGIGASIGPIMMIFGDRDFFDFPVGLDARYTLLLKGMDFSPYVRAGVKNHFASGDYVKSSSAGVYGGIGMELFRNKKVGMGVEFLLDNSSITFDKKTRSGSKVVTGEEKINPTKYSFSVSVVF